MSFRNKLLSSVAVSFGILLIVLETYRRFGHWEQWTSMIDDYAAGGFLIISGIRFRRQPLKNIRLLSVAWAVLAGGFYYSIGGSVEAVHASAAETTGKPSAIVLVIKIMLMLVVMVNLFLCLKWKDEP